MVMTYMPPNAFTPNEDGINDIFSGKGIFIIKYEMSVFDRWGNLIFFSMIPLKVGTAGRIMEMKLRREMFMFIQLRLPILPDGNVVTERL